MTRKWIDCRDFPDETGCTLYLSGEQEHVVHAAAEHAISFHGPRTHRSYGNGFAASCKRKPY